MWCKSKDKNSDMYLEFLKDAAKYVRLLLVGNDII